MGCNRIALSVFVGMALVSCAGTDSSVQTKVEENPNLFKPGTPFADTLASRMPEFARSVFKGVIDSVPGEYYYYATNGRIDSLIQKDGEQYKAVASIAYDSLDGQNNYELKKGNLSYNVNDGKLKTELEFPKYVKTYWDNGPLKKVLTGNLYRDDQGNIALDSGREEQYFKSGKIQWQDDRKNKQIVFSREWNENGTLVAEIDFPNYIKKYWDNGNPREVSTGLLYINDQGMFRLDSGHAEFYFENGKFQELYDWKNKQPVVNKQWNADGVLIMDLDFQKTCTEYWNDGKIKQKLEGILYRKDGTCMCRVGSGRSESYFENGKVKQQNDWENKQLVAQKEWNENGVLVKELELPKFFKEYWKNGKPKTVIAGLLYRDAQGIFRVDSGWSEIYSESGKILDQKKWEDKQVVVCRQWNENGVLLKEIDFPRYFKEYWSNGKLKEKGTGLLYRSNQNIIQVDSGHSEVYFENGKKKEQNAWKNGRILVSKQWNENGILIKEFVIPKYFKEYWSNGKLREVLTGKIFISDQGNFALDSGRSKLYFENGKLEQQKDWKNKQTIAYKLWNERGVLIREFDFPKYAKEYYDNGKIKKEMTGLYFSSPTNVEVENGFKKEYYENGQIKEHKNYKDKEPYSSKQWSEDGTLSIEWDIPAGYSKYYEDGRLRLEKKGSLYLGEEDVLLENGYQILYFKNGTPRFQEQYENKQTIGKKIWDENGTLVIEEDLSKGFYKAYFPSGKISQDISGIFHYRDKHIIFEDCSVKSWYENGQPKTHLIYKEKKLISKTLWYPNGNVAFSAELPNRYREFYDDGKIKAEVTGTIVEENNAFRIKDGVYNMYDVNGKITNSATYKDFQVISDKNNP